MKKVWFRFISLFGFPIRKTQISGNSVPRAIRHNFLRLYPKAYNIFWYIYRGLYEARFVNNDQTTETSFKPTGEVFKQFKVVSIQELPSTIVKKITKGTSGYSVVDVLIDEYHDDPKYKIIFRKQNNLIETDCDTQGNIINQLIN